jgi:NAD(P)-dependent dehydrogenase (short-subunit alcohol dehydrogenase family)
MSGRIVLVTGGTGALGSAVSLTFLRAGDTVVVTYRREGEFKKLVAEAGDLATNLRGFSCDVTDPASVSETHGQIETEVAPVDVLVHVAGGYVDGMHVGETPDEIYDRYMDLNLRSAFLLGRAVMPSMMERRRGKIVTISSRAALSVFSGIGVYAASKAGLIALTQVMAAEGGPHNVQANVVLPSIIDTAVNRAAMPNADPSRWVRPSELAEVIFFLSSDSANAINGASIPVFGCA